MNIFNSKIYDFDNESSISVVIKSIKRANNGYKDQKAIFIITNDEYGFGLETITILSKEKTKELKEKVAKELSDVFGLDYNETLEKVNSENSIETIAKKVEEDKITTLKTWMKENDISSGINIDSDTKRYYPYDNLASNLIGFCGSDNQGLEGLEYYWDSVLTGTPRKNIYDKRCFTGYYSR